MSKLVTLAASRLICVGGARRLTNGPEGGVELESDLIQSYNP